MVEEVNHAYRIHSLQGDHLFAVIYVIEQLFLMLNSYIAMNNILSIFFIPRTK